MQFPQREIIYRLAILASEQEGKAAIRMWPWLGWEMWGHVNHVKLLCMFVLVVLCFWDKCSWMIGGVVWPDYASYNFIESHSQPASWLHSFSIPPPLWCFLSIDGIRWIRYTKNYCCFPSNWNFMRHLIGILMTDIYAIPWHGEPSGWVSQEICST